MSNNDSREATLALLEEALDVVIEIQEESQEKGKLLLELLREIKQLLNRLKD